MQRTTYIVHSLSYISLRDPCLNLHSKYVEHTISHFQFSELYIQVLTDLKR